MRKISKIIIHCTDTKTGNVGSIRNYHINRLGWSDVGYHFIILNGKYISGDFWSLSGSIETGRPLKAIGAHTRGDNYDSIGICLVGKKEFIKAQFASLMVLCFELMKKFNLKVNDIYGHYEMKSGRDQKKTCPNFNMDEFRAGLKDNNCNTHKIRELKNIGIPIKLKMPLKSK